MNFLAHLYLSGESNSVKIGNFIGDYVKGKQYLNFPKEVQKGILLHRDIDSYTDRHPMVLQSSKRLKDGYALYSGVVVDVIYDHFLAKKWMEYHQLPLKKFVSQAHETLVKKYLLLPKRVKMFLPFLIQSRRLESYAQIDGLQKALNIMSKYTSLPNESDYAVDILLGNYKEFEQEFDAFMKDIINHIVSNHQINVATPNGWHPNEGK